MKIILEKIKDSVRAEMETFEDKFKSFMKSKNSLINRVTYYVIRNKGKQMRPLLVFISAKMITEKITEKTYRSAFLIELLHTASLIHDDVVDESNKRRSFFTVNAIWKNKIAVLLGDYFLSKILIISVENEDYDLLKITSNAVKEMSEGEIFQLEKTKKLNITEEEYFKIIYQKTASLISACCESGAKSVTDNIDVIKKYKLLGEYIGISFQMKDDLFDYTNNNIGKPTGIDIKEKKMTLPLIYTLNNISKKEKEWLKKTIKNKNNRKNRKKIISLVDKTGGIEYTKKKMNEYRDKSLELLDEMESSVYKDSFKNLINYVVERKL